MQLKVFALDYDGTIETGGRLDPDVRAAIGDARRQGIGVVLATGRRMADLKRIVGDLTIFDAVVAENGGIVYFPDSDRAIFRAAGPAPGFARALRERGVPITEGECVVEASADDACVIFDVIHEQQVPLVLVFNRNRAMVLPQGISKGTGLHAALDALRVSPHNAIGIGDAENDHSLLEACEIGVAVSWGSLTLRSMADEVLSGTGPAAVAAYIRSMLAHPRLPPERTGRRHLQLGTEPSGANFELELRDRNVLVVGDPRSGKSWLAGLLAEQLILLGYCVCILDPEGDYATLNSLPRVISLGGDDPPPHPREIWRALRYPDTSVVVDLSHLSLDDKREQVAALLPVLASMRAEMGFPHRILLDEAHYFLSDPAIHAQLHLEDGGYLLATYRVDQLPADAVATSELVLATRVTDPREIEALAVYQGVEAQAVQSALAQLALDEAVLLPNAKDARGAVRRIQLLPRLTLHVRHRQKYLDVPVLARHAFVFTRSGAPTGQRAATLAEFVGVIRHGSKELLTGHLRRGDVSRWIREVFGDLPLAAHLARIERRCTASDSTDYREAVAHCIEERYASESL